MGGRARALGAAALTIALAVSGCGSGTGTARHTSSATAVAPSTAAVQSTVTMVTSSFPGSLDPQAGDSAQAAQATWVTDTGLVSYAHRSGVAGGRLIPGLARALPRISDGGRLYTVSLRRGLVFSDGRPVRAGDVVATLERAVRLWPSAPALLDHTIAGAAAFAAGRSRTIAGVTADVRSGRVTIRLTAADGGFDAVLADPALGLVPAGSRSQVGTRNPPPGCGPYVITRVIPGRGYTLVRNPRWRALPGIPSAHVNVDVRVLPDVADAAEAVLNDTADLLDPTTTVPAGLQSQLRAKASGRFADVDTGTSTEYLFLDHAERPFSSRLARRAVVAALDHARLDRIAGGALAPACRLLGPIATGQAATAGCPGGAPGDGDLTQARALLRRSGEVGQPVLVSSPASEPALALMRAVVGRMDAIGLRAELIVDTPAVAAQAGLATLTVGVDPADALTRTLGVLGDENLGEVDEPRLDAAIARLRGVTLPGTRQWQRVDQLIAGGADVAVLGDVRAAYLASARMDYPALRISPVYGWDFTSLRLR